MTRQEKEQLLNTPEEELEIGVKYEGETLYGFYEVQRSSNEWYKNVVLINVCNKFNTMNLLGFKKIK